MRPTNRQVVPILAMFLCLTVWTGSAHAAYQFYVTIEGTKQGKFKGEGVGRDKGWIPCLQFSYQPGAVRDVSGQASGKRQHGQIVIVKERGAASPQIFRAVTTNEVLKQVSFEFVRVTADGREEVYKTLRITKAVLASVRTLTSGGPKDVREEVTLSFEQGNLEAKGPDANPMPVERWMGIQK